MRSPGIPPPCVLGSAAESATVVAAPNERLNPGVMDIKIDPYMALLQSTQTCQALVRRVGGPL
jgi:hypothetical protein